MGDVPADASQTYLFSDVEGSTRLWERHPEAMQDALARHDAILRAAVEGCGGTVVKTTGDGLMAVFGLAPDVITASLAAQEGLRDEPWARRDRGGCAWGCTLARRRPATAYGPDTNGRRWHRSAHPATGRPAIRIRGSLLATCIRYPDVQAMLDARTVFSAW
jgi:class 3 adenylate cyclase